MTPDEVKAWDDFIRGWTPHPSPSSLGPLVNFEKFEWRPGLKPDIDLSHVDVLRPHGINCPDHCGRCKPAKPFLTAKDIVFLREMKVGL